MKAAYASRLKEREALLPSFQDNMKAAFKKCQDTEGPRIEFLTSLLKQYYFILGTPCARHPYVLRSLPMVRTPFSLICCAPSSPHSQRFRRQSPSGPWLTASKYPYPLLSAPIPSGAVLGLVLNPSM